MEIAQIVILIFTFIYSIFEKSLFDKIDEQTGKYRFLKSKYILLTLLFALLVLQVFVTIKTAKEDKRKDGATSIAHSTISDTYNKVTETNSSIDSLLNNITTTLKITETELSLILQVNEDIKNIRNGIEKNLTDFTAIKNHYEQQLQIERNKIDEAKPNLSVVYARTIVDLVSFAYQFRLDNSGIRMADSIIYHSIVLLVDTNFLIHKGILYKSNVDEANTLSLAGKGSNNYHMIFNSEKIDIKDLPVYHHAYFLIKYKYKDNMTDRSESETKVLGCYPCETGTKQFGQNVKGSNLEIIKKFLYSLERNYYLIFFGE